MTYDNSKLRQLIATSPALFDAYLRGVAEEMVSDIKLSLQDTSPGEVQERHNPQRYVIASLPGDPPNVDRGFLIGSIRVVPDGAMRYLIQDGVEYGLGLELGTAEMAARPFVRPVFTHWGKKLPKDMKDKKIIR